MMNLHSKKFAALVVAAALVFPFCFCGGAAPRRDVGALGDVTPGDWYYPYVKRLYEDGVIEGMTDSSYAPGAEVRTSEIAAFVARYLGLEYMAEKSRDFLARNKVEGAGLWYSGYIQLMCDLGIFGGEELDFYGIKLMGGGGAAISESAALAIEAPIKRMDAAKFIAKSFEIKKGRTRTNFLKSEIGGNGNEFINGGGYDREILGQIKTAIADYSEIPDPYREYFQKCFYNGIIRGDEKGKVSPTSTLKRGELAKIIASVLYFELRGSDLRELPEECAIGQGDYFLSPADGAPVLKQEKAERILAEQAKSISAENLKDSVSISVSQKNIIPAGYLAETYIYAYESGTPAMVGALNCASNADAYYPKEASFQIPKTGASGASLGFVYLVLRDLKRRGEVAGALMYEIGASGNLKNISARELP